MAERIHTYLTSPQRQLAYKFVFTKRVLIASGRSGRTEFQAGIASAEASKNTLGQTLDD
jgi:hypothetical protein